MEQATGRSDSDLQWNYFLAQVMNRACGAVTMDGGSIVCCQAFKELLLSNMNIYHLKLNSRHKGFQCKLISQLP